MNDEFKHVIIVWRDEGSAEISTYINDSNFITQYSPYYNFEQLNGIEEVDDDQVFDRLGPDKIAITVETAEKALGWNLYAPVY